MRNNFDRTDSSVAITMNTDTSPKDVLPKDVIEKASLIDISANKQWIAYITEDATTERKYLRIRRFKIPDISDDLETTVDSISTKNSGTNSDDPEKFDITEYILKDGTNYCYFLSISPTGKRIALSFLKMNKDGVVENQEKVYNPDTIIFKVGSADNCIHKAKRIKFKGRAVFLKNGNLALINKEILKVYDCQRRYRKIHWFNLYPLGATSGSFFLEAIDGFESLVKTSYVHFEPYQLDPNASDAKDIIRISKHIRHNVLTTTYRDHVSRVWSITEDGVRLTSFHSLSKEEIMAFSLDYKYLATFVGKDKSINIYNVKSGLVVNRLKQDKDKKSEKIVVDNSSDFQIYVCFCHKSQYLAMVSIVKLQETDGIESENNALITFEVWNIVPEKSIYYDTEEIKIDWEMQDKFIQPFVYEEIKTEVHGMPKFKVIYSTSINDGMSKIKVKNLDIFSSMDKNQNESNILWRSINYAPSTSDQNSELDDFIGMNHIYELDNNLNDYNDLYCFQRKIGERSYLLRFGEKTVQLWQVLSFENGGKITKYDKLIYIRAFKAPFYGFNEAYTDTWYQNTNDALYESVNRFQGKQDGRIVISIGHDEESEENSEFGSQSEINNHYKNEPHNTEEIYLPMKYINDPNDTSFIYEYHYFESACQALHYLWGCIQNRKYINQEEPQMQNINSIYEQTKNIVKRSIRGMRGRESKYFTTIAGSNTLAMLASFEIGREIIFDIIETEELAITLFSYVRSSSHQNALTILIEEFDYDLYELMFNRVIYHSKQLGTGCFSAITDALVYLQERGNKDLLLSSSQKLSFMQIDKKILTILESEVGEEMHMSTLHKDLIPDFRDLESHSTREQVSKYNNQWFLPGWIDHLYYWWSIYISHYCKHESKKIWHKITTSNFITNLFKKESGKVSESLIKLCVVPLPHFNSYSYFPEDRNNRHQIPECKATEHSVVPESTRCFSFLGPNNNNDDEDTTVIPYKSESAFIKLATNQHENDIFHLGDTVLEVLLQYKWEKFARKRFLMVYCIYLTYYISYSVGVAFSREVFGYELGTPISNNDGHLACIIIMFFTGGILLLQELHQFIKSHSKPAYLVSLYNIIDIAAFVLPVITFWQISNDVSHLEEVCSIATLILWLHGILRLRVISLFGVTLETIIQLVQSVYKVLIIMLLVIFAFTNSFMVLLSRRDDSFFQEQFEGSLDLTNSNLAEENSMSYNDASANNNFGNPFKSFSMLWFFIFGVWDPINDGDAGDDYMVMVLAILFSFLTALIFFNLVIALMSSKVEEVRTRGKKVWISHFAAIVAEIEQLWCTKYENRCRKNNPTFIYYIAKTSDIKLKDEWLKNQTDELIKQLKDTQADKDRKSRPNYIKSVDDLKDLVKEDTDRLIEQLEKHDRNSTSNHSDLIKKVKEHSKQLQEDVDELKAKLDAALSVIENNVL